MSLLGSCVSECESREEVICVWLNRMKTGFVASESSFRIVSVCQFFVLFHGSSYLILFQTIVDSSLYTEVKLFIADLTLTSTISQIIESDTLAVCSPSVQMCYANFISNELDWVTFKNRTV